MESVLRFLQDFTSQGLALKAAVVFLKSAEGLVTITAAVNMKEKSQCGFSCVRPSSVCI